jgi:hypothetical protein
MQVEEVAGRPRPEGLILEATGKGERTKFTATTPVTCGCGRKSRVCAIRLTEETQIDCPACGLIWRMTFPDVEKVEEELSLALCEYFEDRDQEQPDDDVMDFIMANGRFPAARSRRR